MLFFLFVLACDDLLDDLVDLLHHIGKSVVGFLHFGDELVMVQHMLGFLQRLTRLGQLAPVQIGIGQQFFHLAALLGIVGHQQGGFFVLHHGLLGQAHVDVFFAFQNGFRQQFRLIEYLFHDRLTPFDSFSPEGIDRRGGNSDGKNFPDIRRRTVQRDGNAPAALA